MGLAPSWLLDAYDLVTADHPAAFDLVATARRLDMRFGGGVLAAMGEAALATFHAGAAVAIGHPIGGGGDGTEDAERLRHRLVAELLAGHLTPP